MECAFASSSPSRPVMSSGSMLPSFYRVFFAPLRCVNSEEDVWRWPKPNPKIEADSLSKVEKK